MADLAQNPIGQYSRSNVDKLYADSRESLFGHLVVERGRSVKTALEELRPHVKQALKATEVAASWCQKLGVGGVGLGVLVGTSMGISCAALPLIAGCLNLKFWADSRDEMPRREAEFHLLRECSNLPEALYALHLRGVDTAVLVGAYDALVSSVEARLERGADFSEAEVGQFLEAKITALGTIASVTSQSQQGIQPINDAQNNAIAQDATTAVAPSIQHITSPVWNPAQDLGENPQSALIVGTPGSGKGMTVSNAVRVLKSQNPNLTVMMIDPKGDPKEKGYWEPVTDIFESFALMDCLDPDEGAEWLLQCMSKFQKLPAPKFLIFDELLAASIELEMADKSMKALPKLKKFMAGIVAQGDSRGVWVWAMSQSPQCADLGLNGGVRGNLRIIAIVSPKNTTAIQVITSTKLVPMVEGGMDELRAIMAASPVGRAVFDGKIARWLPMPELENHSGFDRDNRSLSSETQKLSQGQVNWEPLKVGSPAFPDAIDAIDVEVQTVAIDDRPIGLNEFPLVATIWDYLGSKEPRTIKQISDAMRNSGKIPDEILQAKIPNYSNYKDGIRSVLSFGISNGFLVQIGDSYQAVKPS